MNPLGQCTTSSFYTNGSVLFLSFVASGWFDMKICQNERQLVPSNVLKSFYIRVMLKKMWIVISATLVVTLFAENRHQHYGRSGCPWSCRIMVRDLFFFFKKKSHYYFIFFLPRLLNMIHFHQALKLSTCIQSKYIMLITISVTYSLSFPCSYGLGVP